MQNKKKEPEKIFKLSEILKNFDIKKQNIFKIDLIIGDNNIREKLFDLGIIEGDILKIVRIQNSGPAIVFVNNIKFFIGTQMASRIFVEFVESAENEKDA